jgi:hypothetical protein
MLAAPKRPGSLRVPRVVFGVSPNRVFRRDAGNCTRGRVRSPDLPETVAPLRFPEMISERCFNQNYRGRLERPARLNHIW